MVRNPKPDRFGRCPAGPRPTDAECWPAGDGDAVYSGETRAGLYGVSGCRACGANGTFRRGWRFWRHRAGCPLATAGESEVAT